MREMLLRILHFSTSEGSEAVTQSMEVEGVYKTFQVASASRKDYILSAKHVRNKEVFVKITKCKP
jgi:hypothetical protein